MIKKILPFLIPVIAATGGVIAGEMLRPAGDTENVVSDEQTSTPASPVLGDPATFSFSDQFFVPMMRNGDMGAVMILTLSIESDTDTIPALEKQEHRLRDALLRQLMIRANSGGFDGNFTAEQNLKALRDDLLAAVKQVSDLPIAGVLIGDIGRQAG